MASSKSLLFRSIRNAQQKQANNDDPNNNTIPANAKMSQQRSLSLTKKQKPTNYNPDTSEPSKKRKLPVGKNTGKSKSDMINNLLSQRTVGVVDNVHRCPICGNALCSFDYDDGLSLKQNFLKYRRDAEFEMKRIELGWNGKLPSRGKEDAIVATTCGELYHKKCLMRHCSLSYSVRGAPPVFGKAQGATCPRCSKGLMISHFRDIDLDAHRFKYNGNTTTFEKGFSNARASNHQLTYGRDRALNGLRNVKKQLQTAKRMLECLREKRTEVERKLPVSQLVVNYEIEKMQKRKAEKVWLEAYIEKSQEVIEYMQKETPYTMRQYLREIQDRPLDEIPKRTSIPRMLIPYLHKIASDDYCLSALAHILEPRPFPGTKFETDDLILGILNKVNPTLRQQLVVRSKASGSSVLRAYDEMFPDTFLKMLKSSRESQKKLAKQINEDTPRPSSAPAHEPDGSELKITILYMVDEEKEPKEIPSSHEFTAQRASDFLILKSENISARSSTSELSQAETLLSSTTTVGKQEDSNRKLYAVRETMVMHDDEVSHKLIATAENSNESLAPLSCYSSSCNSLYAQKDSNSLINSKATLMTSSIYEMTSYKPEETEERFYESDSFSVDGDGSKGQVENSVSQEGAYDRKESLEAGDTCGLKQDESECNFINLGIIDAPSSYVSFGQESEIGSLKSEVSIVSPPPTTASKDVQEHGDSWTSILLSPLPFSPKR